MRELNLTLDFACCGCERPVSVTVQCSGGGLMSNREGNLAAVTIPCPTCGQLTELVFEPSGKIRSVHPYTCIRLVPEPSVN